MSNYIPISLLTLLSVAEMYAKRTYVCVLGHVIEQHGLCPFPSVDVVVVLLLYIW